jgi:signal transduction histidine kinase
MHNDTRHHAEVVTDIQCPGPVLMKRGEMQQIIINLVGNAAQAMEKFGKITVRTEARDGRVWMTVSDNGKGMDEATLKRIFEPFFTTKPVGKGTGLGLTIVYNLVEKAQGAIDVKSVPGQGTTFTLSFKVQE